ncbi:helix-turn-helix domain-containing protein [Serratia liquefaciens]|jgi:DNA-binding transcriptional regulator YdaS (Cro superfamily)|uniref:YdaS family helix-turn-helix protein n=1 Tax=Serratia liquefaciens TaxID=614 RepID=UPI002361DDE7|nr:YdaS family helix-turn-helix protein [Serratia liquefaciens]
MEKYWDSLSKEGRSSLASQVGRSPDYLRLVFKGHKKASFALAQRIEEVTGMQVTKNDLRPDIYGKSTSVKAGLAATNRGGNCG